MKNRYLLTIFFLSFLFSPCINATIIRQTSINEQAKQIRTEMMRDRFCFYGLASIGVAYQLGLVYGEWHRALNNSAAAGIAATQEKQTIWQSFQAMYRYLLYTQEGWTSTTHVCVSIVGSVFASKLCEKFAHPDTLRWYIRTHAPYHATITMMKEKLETLQDDSIDEEHYVISWHVIELLYARLIRQAELICAYMTYKTNRLDDEEKMIAEQIKNSLLHCHNDWLQRIENHMGTEEWIYDYAELNQLLCEYEESIRLHLRHFATILYEPYREEVVKKDLQEIE